MNGVTGSRARTSRVVTPLIALVLVGIAALALAGGYYESGGQFGVDSRGLAGFRNLKVTTTGAADNVSVLITADKLLVTDDSDGVKVLANLNLTDNLATAGAGGLDNGSLNKNVGYFIYVVWNGSTTAALASTSATAPVLPAGYTKKALVSWVTTDNTAPPYRIVKFTQVDDVYTWDVKQELFNPGGAVTTAAVNLAAGGVFTYAVVPPTITKGVFGKVTSPGGWVFINAVTFANSIATENNATEVAMYLAASASGTWEIHALQESQTFYWQIGTNQHHLYLNGFTLKR